MHSRIRDLDAAISKLDVAIADCRRGPVIDLARVRALKEAREKSWRALQGLALEMIQ